LGEDEVKICVVLKPGATLIPEELIKYCNDRMPYFAVPRFVEFMESLPKTPTDRVEKYKLKQAGITTNTWDREKAGVQVTR
jgi:carnitine-CoA ligase